MIVGGIGGFGYWDFKWVILRSEIWGECVEGMGGGSWKVGLSVWEVYG